MRRHADQSFPVPSFPTSRGVLDKKTSEGDLQGLAGHISGPAHVIQVAHARRSLRWCVFLALTTGSVSSSPLGRPRTPIKTTLSLREAFEALRMSIPCRTSSSVPVGAIWAPRLATRSPVPPRVTVATGKSPPSFRFTMSFRLWETTSHAEHPITHFLESEVAMNPICGGCRRG